MVELGPFLIIEQDIFVNVIEPEITLRDKILL